MRRVHYAWVVAAVGFVTLITAAGFRSTPGVLIVLPALAAITDAWGWRYTSVTVSVVAFVLVLPLAALLLRDRPADLGVAPFGGSEIEDAPASVGNPFAAATSGLLLARRSRDFW